MKRARLAAGTERLQRCEAEMQEKIVSAVDAAREHQIRFAVMQPIAGELDRVERRRAGRVERERCTREAEHARGEMHGQS